MKVLVEAVLRQLKIAYEKMESDSQLEYVFESEMHKVSIVHLKKIAGEDTKFWHLVAIDKSTGKSTSHALNHLTQLEFIELVKRFAV